MSRELKILHVLLLRTAEKAWGAFLSRAAVYEENEGGSVIGSRKVLQALQADH